jgi:hypothetical protein
MITATRVLWDSLIHTKVHRTNCTHIVRLPIFQHNMEMGHSPVVDSSTLAAAAPLREEDKYSLVMSLIHDLTELYASRSVRIQWLADSRTGEKRHLPTADKHGNYHVDGRLQVAGR